MVQRQVELEEEEEESTVQTKSLSNQVTPLIQRRVDEEEVKEEEEQTTLQTKPLSSPGSLIQRQVESEEEEIEPDEDEEFVQSKQVYGQAPGVSSNLVERIRSLRGGGQPLPEFTRAFFETRFGHNFSDVRVHTDARAAETAKAVNAQAFTVGRDVVFGGGQYPPETAAGKGLLAHELTHVVQQKSGVQRSTIQREEAAEEEKKAKVKAEENKKEALGLVSEYERNWKEIRKAATEFGDVAPWLTQGDSVVALIRTHTVAALDASEKGDRELYLAYKTALESDIIMSGFIAWHTIVYVNLLGLKGDIKGLIESFDADKREFTGRAEAERLVRDFQKEIDKVPKHSSERLGLVRVNIPMVVRKGRTNEVTITVTSAAIEKVRPLFVAQIDALIPLQRNIQLGVAKVNEFLANARAEGVVQAIDAIRQFVEVRGQLRGRVPKASKIKPKPQKKAAEGKKPTKEKKLEEKKKAEEKKPEEKKDKKERKTCATQYPTAINCARLPAEYKFPTHQAALAALKVLTGKSNLRIVSSAIATRGPCPGVGMHYGVKSNGKYIASIGCCPCCKDMAAGPVMLTLCRII